MIPARQQLQTITLNLESARSQLVALRNKLITRTLPREMVSELERKVEGALLILDAADDQLTALTNDLIVRCRHWHWFYGEDAPGMEGEGRPIKPLV